MIILQCMELNYPQVLWQAHNHRSRLLFLPKAGNKLYPFFGLKAVLALWILIKRSHSTSRLQTLFSKEEYCHLILETVILNNIKNSYHCCKRGNYGWCVKGTKNTIPAVKENSYRTNGIGVKAWWRAQC